MDLFRNIVGLPLQSEIKEASIRAEKAKITGSLDAVKAPILQSPIPTVPHHPKGVDAIDDQGNPTFAAVETKETVREDTTVVNKSTNRKRRSRRRRKRK